VAVLTGGRIAKFLPALLRCKYGNGIVSFPEEASFFPGYNFEDSIEIKIGRTGEDISNTVDE
jgi:hypothetical protein